MLKAVVKILRTVGNWFTPKSMAIIALGLGVAIILALLFSL